MTNTTLNIKALQNKYRLKNIPYVEYIWGHRFRTDQTPMLLLFELFCVIENQYQAKRKGLIENIFSQENSILYFKHRQCLKLRALLYQNEILETIYRSKAPEQEKWNRQAEYLKRFGGQNIIFEDNDINHIRKSHKTFDSFYNSLRILNSLTFDQLSNKRWTSKFVFPINSQYIWCDFNSIDNSEDRRFFSRGGELVYLMLCRCSDKIRAELECLFTDWLESDNDCYSNLAKSLVLPEERIPLENIDRRNLGYLPTVNMDCINTISEDIVKTLKLNMERLDKIKLLSDMIGFHIGNYIYSTHQNNTDLSHDKQAKYPKYMVEVLTKTTNSIRKASIQSISTQRNRIKMVLLDNIPSLFESCNDDTEETDTEDMLEKSKNEAIDYFNNNILGYPHICFKHIGFVSKKNARSYRYVITEDFLHSLVITTLGENKRMEFRKFVKALIDRYNIYIDQAPANDSEILQRDLNRNVKLLSNLLYQMGMLRHLSDACSYVINPYLEDTL